MSKRRSAGVFIFVLGLVVGMAGWAAATKRPPARVEGFRAMHPAISGELLANAVAVREPWRVDKSARIFILPHHVVAAKEIASLVGAIERPSVVYLLSPDHFTRGKTVLTTNDKGLAARVASASVDGAVIQREHGVTTVTPFFERLQPDVPVVPMLIRIDAATSSRGALVQELVRRMRVDPRAVLVASIDFSHYLPSSVADFHDVLAEDVIRALAANDADSVELDSPGALAVTLAVARELGLGNAEIYAHTSSLRLMRARIARESTSHFFVSFAPGSFNRRHVRTFLLTNAFDVKSQENRFYRGMTGIIRATTTEPSAIGIVERDGVEVGRISLPVAW